MNLTRTWRTYVTAKALLPESRPRVLSTEIVCGNCAGDETIPVRTYLTGENCCASCGGRSYALASKLCRALAQHLIVFGDLKNESADANTINRNHSYPAAGKGGKVAQFVRRAS